jgi:hypothetical protein
VFSQKELAGNKAKENIILVKKLSSPILCLLDVHAMAKM